MINLSYDRQNNKTRIDTKDLSILGNDVKLKFNFVNIVNNEINYSVDLGSYMWAEWVGAELITKVEVFNSQNKLIYVYEWNVLENGDDIEKLLWLYLNNRYKNGEKSKGLIIGTHDGRNGHWIYPVNQELSDVLLVEGSEEQFNKLVKNYKHLKNVNFLNEIITTDGSDVDWYQGGEGYTDSVLKNIPLIFLQENELRVTKRKSKSINSLLNELNYNWIHLDVEGIDADLILSIEKFPEVIVYENMNLEFEKNLKLDQWISENRYKKIECNGNTILFRENLF
jgi:hypothetical protein